MMLFQEYQEEKREMDRKKMKLYDKTYDQEQKRLYSRKREISTQNTKGRGENNVY